MISKLNIAVALIAGIFGGVVTRYIAPPVALAQNQTPVTKEVRAQSFTLVDPSDHVLGTFTAESMPGHIMQFQRLQPAPVPIPGPSRIVLRDSNGHEIWSAGGTGAQLQPLSFK